MATPRTTRSVTSPTPRRRRSLGDFEQLLGLNGVAPIATSEIDEGSAAVLYLRVSTTRQMETAADIDEDGNSIATQREWGHKRCERLKAPVDEEFVEPGNSAQSIARRPVFRRLLRYVEENPHIGYVVIYMRSRAFRNYTDAAIAKRVLASMGVKLISAKEEFGEGYMADAMEAITDIMNEVQVRQSGEDIRNKMYHKAKSGGTTGRAKLGYLNTRKDFDGRLVNTIDTDPVRAPLIKWAFEQYATGEYSLVALREALAEQGLTTRKTSKWPEKPVSRTQLGAILRNPYYLGMVTFKGELFPGRHEAIITPELFERVQHVMDERMQRNQRDTIHNHFLRGTLRCFRCHQQGRKRQLIYSQPVNKAGQAYQYYTCRSRSEHLCDLPNLRVVDVEQAILREISRLRLTPDEITLLREQTTQQLHKRLDLEHELEARLTKQAAKLDAHRSHLIDLGQDGVIDKEELRARLNETKVKRLAVQRKLDNTQTHIWDETQRLLLYLDLLERPSEFYAAASDEVKRKILRAFYQNLWIDDDGHQTTVASQPREPIIELHHRARHEGGVAGATTSSACAACSNKTDVVRTVDRQSNNPQSKRTRDHSVACSNKTSVAPGAGFEPAA